MKRLLFSDRTPASWYMPSLGQKVPALNKTQSSEQSAALICMQCHNVWVALCLGGKMSRLQNVRVSKCLSVKMSKCLGVANGSSEKCRVLKCRRTIRSAPTPLTPPIGGAKVFFGGLLLMDHSDHQRVKYFFEALGFKYHLGYPWGVPRPPDPLPP